MMISFKYMKACCKGRRKSLFSCPQLSKETEMFKKQKRRFRKTLLGGVAARAWCESTGERGKKNTKSKLLEGKKTNESTDRLSGEYVEFPHHCHQTAIKKKTILQLFIDYLTSLKHPLQI